MPMVTGVVLAGGVSRRMGRDKALLQLFPDGPTFLARAAETLHVACERVIVVAPHERGYSMDGLDVVPDRWPGKGPVGGILTALEAISGGFALVLACDYPLVSADLLREISQRDGDAPALIAMAGGSERSHPLVGRYTGKYWAPIFRDAVVEGLWTLEQVLKRGDVKYLVVDEERWGHGALLNVNTEEDLTRARSIAAGEASRR